MSEGTTHWHNCYAFGREHYDCLLAEAARRGDEVKRLREALREAKGYMENTYAPSPKYYLAVMDMVTDALAAGEVEHE